MPNAVPPPSPLAKLLVIDDEVTLLKLVSTMLTRAHYQVTTCSSGADGLRLLNENSYDCVITDAIMPEMTGYEFVKTVREHPHFNQLPVLMLTRKRNRQDVKLAVQAGVTDYVLKPIDEHLLLDKVEMCVKKGSGKRHIYEHSVSGEYASAQIHFECRIQMISETDITVRVPYPINELLSFEVISPIFDDIGIPIPMLKLYRCDRIEDGLVALPYEAKLSFMGTLETDLKKIRSWLQRQEIQRRK